MADSLQDQLRKSGLVSAQKTREASADKRKRNRKLRAGHEDKDAARRAEIDKQNAEKVARDRELNAARDATAHEKALGAQVRQLVEMNRIGADGDGDDAVNHHFEVDGKIRQLMVSNDIHRAVTVGQVAIVRDDERFALIPRAAAEKIMERDTAHHVVVGQ